MSSSLAGLTATSAAEGTDISHQEDGNVLQKHVAFFDQNNDGVVYPWETFRGFREIGCGLLLSSFAAVFINLGLSAKTRTGKYSSLLLPVEINNINKAKHGSDSGVYDTQGRFVNSKFEEMFSKHANTNSSALTSDELTGFLKSNREPKDYKGWFASYTEWKMLYFLCKDKDGLLHKDTIRGVYDGTLFERMAKERKRNLSDKKSA
ncbi:putative peroxygenase 4 [Heracleum sosnowskyi]|uniref:Peroxygenase 4 n=1 Tax=Heracleum sosnowskyi TaxID=360622 RepID=A0AAD8IQ81_9APIA|nr:putative peroxygenase 4 [Heracleum sosnowskyi]